MSKYRIVQYGSKGRFEPQIQTGWLWKTWDGFIDPSRPPYPSISGGLCFHSKTFKTKKEAEDLLKRVRKQKEYEDSGDSQTKVFDYES